MASRWYGFRDIGKCGFSPPLDTSIDFHVSFNSPSFNDGDKILRTLFGWRIETEYTGSFGGITGPMWPAFVVLDFTPDPDGEPTGGAETSGGAHLARSIVAWEQVEHYDGTIAATKWYANSYQLLDMQGTRIIHDKTSAELILSFGYDMALPNFQGISPIGVDTNVNLWVEFLVQQ